MPVPNTNTFTLQDVKSEIESNGGSTSNTLVNAFSNSLDVGFDPLYKGSKNQLLNFRNYSHVVSNPIYSNPSWRIQDIVQIGFKDLTIPNFIGTFNEIHGIHLNNSGTKGVVIHSHDLGSKISITEIIFNNPWAVSTAAVGTTHNVSLPSSERTYQGTGSAVSKDRLKIFIPVRDPNAASFTVKMKTITLTSGSSLPVVSSSTSNILTPPTSTNLGRVDLLVSGFSDNSYAFTSSNNGGGYTRVMAKKIINNFNTYGNGFTLINPSGNAGGNLGYYTPFATIGLNDEFMIIYDNTTSNSNGDSLDQYSINTSSLTHITNRQYSNFSNLSGHILGVDIPKISKLYWVQSKTSGNIRLTESNTNF